MNLDAHLPPHLRGPGTTITRASAGLSGAGVYRVDAAGQAFMLKVSDPSEPAEHWRMKLQIQRSASDAGLAPAIVHVDEEHRSVLSEFVADKSFPMLYFNPATREAALSLLGRTFRRVHGLPIPPGAQPRDALAFIQGIWSGIPNFYPLPPFVRDAVQRVLAETPPPKERAFVLCHNDANPTNFVFDGERLLLLDWETSGPNDPFFDLAVLSVFLRMDVPTCLKLLSAYGGAQVSSIPDGFGYFRRLAALMPGTMFLHMARLGGHPGASGTETIESTVSLADVYARIRTGGVNIATPEGQWMFGLSLIKESVTL